MNSVSALHLEPQASGGDALLAGAVQIALLTATCGQHRQHQQAQNTPERDRCVHKSDTESLCFIRNAAENTRYAGVRQSRSANHASLLQPVPAATTRAHVRILQNSGPPSMRDGEAQRAQPAKTGAGRHAPAEGSGHVNLQSRFNFDEMQEKLPGAEARIPRWTARSFTSPKALLSSRF